MAPSHDPTYPLFPIFSFLGFILSAIPFSWHLQAWNSGTCAFMIWTGLACLNGFINSLVWKGNSENPAPVWCDISSKLIIGVSIGIPAATLCISRRLYALTSVSTVSVTRADKRRMVIVDLCISFGIPAIIMVLHYVVQGHRFDILEDVGCYPVVYNTLLAYFLYIAWPVILGIFSFVFSCLTLRSFWIRRAQFSQLVTSNSSMSMSRYLRLMILALVDIVCTVPLSAYPIYLGTHGVPLHPWVSWEETHYGFSRVDRIPALFWRSSTTYVVGVELTRWLPVLCAFLFFALFGFASEAQKQYKRAYWAIVKPFGIEPHSAKQPIKVALPSWVKSANLDSTLSPKPHMRQHKQHVSLASTANASVDIASTVVGSDLEKSACRSSFSSIRSAPPTYSPSVPHHVALDVDIDQRSLFPSSPLSSDSTVFCPESPREKLPEPYTYSLPKSQFTRTSFERSNPSSPLSPSNHPGFHRPFSPPITYPPTTAHPSAAVAVDVIRATLRPLSQASDNLMFDQPRTMV
uniref:Pheromone receptor n=1 Tax=Coprinopsis cinerea TaxID=5346 RepID=O74283_COPCI|nr:pheromone receptor [Coprinopsis cinerea]